MLNTPFFLAEEDPSVMVFGTCDHCPTSQNDASATHAAWTKACSAAGVSARARVAYLRGRGRDGAFMLQKAATDQETVSVIQFDLPERTFEIANQNGRWHGSRPTKQRGVSIEKTKSYQPPQAWTVMMPHLPL